MSLQGDVGSVFFFFSFFFFCEKGDEDWNQAFVHERQGLYHWTILQVWGGKKPTNFLYGRKKRRKIWCGFHHVEIIFSVTMEDPTGDLSLMTSTSIRVLFRYQAPSQWLEMPHLHPLSYPWNKSLHIRFINEKFQLYNREGYLPCLINRETKSDPLSLDEKTLCLIIHLKCLGLSSLAIIYETSKPRC